MKKRCANCDKAEAKVQKLVQALKEYGYRGHYNCDEDNWYSCPRHPDGCSNPGAGTECLCGAEEHNAALDAILASLEDGP